MNCDHEKFNPECLDCSKEKIARYKKALSDCWLAIDEFFNVIKEILPEDTIGRWKEACETMRKENDIS